MDKTTKAQIPGSKPQANSKASKGQKRVQTRNPALRSPMQWQRRASNAVTARGARGALRAQHPTPNVESKSRPRSRPRPRFCVLDYKEDDDDENDAVVVEGRSRRRKRK